MPFLSLVTLTFDLDLQTCPSEGPNRSSVEFGANPFSGSGDISYIDKKKPQTDGTKNRTFRGSLPAVTKLTTQQKKHLVILTQCTSALPKSTLLCCGYAAEGETVSTCR